ncbi:hypothetical protein D3C76_1206130 [compost metagenome]
MALHQGDTGAATEEHAGGIDLHDPLPVLQLGGFDRAGLQHPGIVEQDVQPAMTLAEAVHHPLPIRLARGVVADEPGGSAQLLRQRLAGLGVDIADQHLRPLRHQQPRTRRADAPGPAGDQGDLALDTSVRFTHDATSQSTATPAPCATAAPARRPENTQSARDRPLI